MSWKSINVYGYEIVEPPGAVVDALPASTLIPPPKAAVAEPSCRSCGRTRRWHPDFIHSPAGRSLSTNEVIRLWNQHPQLCAECIMQEPEPGPQPEPKAVRRRIRFGPKKSA